MCTHICLYTHTQHVSIWSFDVVSWPNEMFQGSVSRENLSES